MISQWQIIVACAAKGLVKPMELLNVLLMPDAWFHQIAEDVGLGHIF